MRPAGWPAQGGYDAFLRRDAANLLGPIERSGPENIVLHGTDAFGWGGAGGSIIWFNVRCLLRFVSRRLPS